MDHNHNASIGINPFKDVVKDYSDDKVFDIINHRENYSSNLHSACVAEAKIRNISLNEVALENLLPYSEIEELKEIRRELSIGLTDENIVNYLVVSGFTLTEAENKLQLAKKINYIPKTIIDEEELEPNYSERFVNVIMGMFKFVLILVIIFKLLITFFGN